MGLSCSPERPRPALVDSPPTTGGTFKVDDTGTNTSNRLVAHSFSTVGGGTFSFLGNASATSTDGFLSYTPGRGLTTISVTPGVSGQANLSLTATTGTITRAAYSTTTFLDTTGNFGTTVGAGVATISTGVGGGGCELCGCRDRRQRQLTTASCPGPLLTTTAPSAWRRRRSSEPAGSIEILPTGDTTNAL